MGKARICVRDRLTAQVKGLSFEQMSELDEAFAVPHPAAEHIKRRARYSSWAQDWDGKQHLINVKTGTFPLGLVAQVQKHLRTQKIRAEIKNPFSVAMNAQMEKALKRVNKRMLSGNIELRDYQLEGIKAALQAHGGVFHLATGAGKTAVGSALCKVLKEGWALYVVPNKKLLTQTRKEVAAFLGVDVEEIGAIRGGEFNPKAVTIALINSLSPSNAKQRKLVNEYLKTVFVLILDEVHHAAAKTWLKVLKRCGAWWRFGMSGTPFDRTDGRSIFVEAYCGPAVAKIGNDELIRRGINAKPKIRFKSIDKVIDYNDDEIFLDGPYDVVYKAGIVRNKYFHEKIVAAALKHANKGRPTLVLIKEYEHGFALMDRFEEHGYGRVEFVHGKMADEDVEEAKERFASGETQIMVASPVFGEGQNLLAIRALVVADDFKSVILILQRIGRGLRKKKGDNTLYVTEFAHTAHHYLAEHSLARYEVYEREKFDVK